MENGLSMYFKRFGNYKLLTAEEELELGKRIAEGDKKAREHMINANLRLVVKIAKSYQNKNISFDELVSAGNIGLITAVDKYDYTRGLRFSTCAVPWIKQSITKYIMDNGRIVRLPAHIIQMLNNEKKVVADFNAQGIAHPTDEQIAAKMGITLKKYIALAQWKLNAISLDTPLGEDEDADTVADLIANDSETPEEFAEKENLHNTIVAAINELKPRERRIMKLRFGISEPGDDEEYKSEHTLDEIGDMLDPQISRERVRQIVAEILNRWKVSGRFASYSNLI